MKGERRDRRVGGGRVGRLGEFFSQFQGVDGVRQRPSGLLVQLGSRGRDLSQFRADPGGRVHVDPIDQTVNHKFVFLSVGERKKYMYAPVDAGTRQPGSNTLALEALLFKVADIPRPQSSAAQHDTTSDLHGAVHGTDFLQKFSR